MNPEEFLDFVRKEFAPLAERHGFRELGVPHDKNLLKSIVFSNGKRAVEFYLDVRDGYLDALHSSASIYTSDASLVKPVIQSVSTRRSVGALLKSEGISWPTREGGLFKPGALERAVGELIAGMERHSDELFK